MLSATYVAHVYTNFAVIAFLVALESSLSAAGDVGPRDGTLKKGEAV